jgi:rhodanese-related sulfurtransferase
MQEITVDEVKSRLDAGEDLHIIDVREPHEHVEYNIGAKLIPLGQIMNMQIDDLEEWKNDEVKRSMQACMMLETMGFTNVKNVIGGVLAWQEKFGK